MTYQNIKVTLLQAYAKTESLVFSKPFRHWAILISSVGLLSGLCDYYLTFYLNFRSIVYNADLITASFLYNDITKGVNLSGWTAGSVPFVFPDLTLFFPLRWLSGNLHIALALNGAVQILLFTLGLILLARQVNVSFHLEQYIPIILAGTLFFASMASFHPYVQIFAVTTYHFGIMVIMPYALALALALLKPRPLKTARYWCLMVALFISLYLLSASDLVAVIQIVAPMIGATSVLLLFRKVSFRPAVVVVGFSSGAAIAGYITLKAIPLFGDSFNSYVAGFIYKRSISDTFTSFVNTVLSFAAEYPFHTALIVIFIILCTVILVREIRKAIRQQPTVSTSIIFFALIFLINLVVIPLATIISSSFKDSTNFRYFLPILVLPAFWGLPIILPAFISPQTNRVISVFGLGILLIGVGFNGLNIIGQSPRVRLDQYYPDAVRCIDEKASELGVHYGLASYWQAKPLTALSQVGLNIVQVKSTLEPQFWVNNSIWYDMNPEFVVIDTRSHDINPETIINRYGEPASTFYCQNLTVLLYNRSNDIAFSQQLRNSVVLAHVDKPGDVAEFHAAYLPGQIGENSVLQRTVENGAAGYLIYGPYLQLPAGQYTFEVDYAAESNANSIATWDAVFTQADRVQVLKSGLVLTHENIVEDSFTLSASGKIQIRVRYNGRGKLTIDKIVIRKIS
jgi:hypothetical protein